MMMVVVIEMIINNATHDDGSNDGDYYNEGDT